MYLYESNMYIGIPNVFGTQFVINAAMRSNIPSPGSPSLMEKFDMVSIREIYWYRQQFNEDPTRIDALLGRECPKPYTLTTNVFCGCTSSTGSSAGTGTDTCSDAVSAHAFSCLRSWITSNRGSQAGMFFLLVFHSI